MPVRPDPDQSDRSLLCADDGTPLARAQLRDDSGTPVADHVQPLPGADPGQVAAYTRRDLAGRRLETADQRLADALVGGGLTLKRVAVDMRHDRTDLPEPPVLPTGWSLTDPGWDDDLAEGLPAAYGPGHPDGGWTANDTAQIRAMFERADPVPPLAPASARAVGPDGRSVGHVLTAGPVPWTGDGCAWILNLAVAPAAQRRGLGWALLVHTLRGSRDAGLPTVGLSVADANPARRMYDRAGFRPVTRVHTLHLPGPSASDS